MAITHSFISAKVDGVDTSKVRPSDWNAAHVGTATPSLHNILDSTYHGDVLTGAITRGDLLYGNATPKIARLALGGISGSIVTRDATDVVWSAFALAGTSGQTYMFPAVSGTMALGAGTLTVATANDVTVAAHTHTVTSSSNPGAAAEILASNASGGLQLVTGGFGVAPSANQILTVKTATATNIALVLQTSDGNVTNYLLAVKSSSGSTLGGWNPKGGIYSTSLFNSASGADDSTADIRGTWSVSDAGGTKSVIAITATSSHTSGTLASLSNLRSVINASGNGGTTGSAFAIRVRVNSLTGHIVTSSAAFYAEDGGGAGTVTTQYGYYCGALTKGGTNYAFYSLGGMISFTHNADSILLTLTGHTTLAAATPIASLVRNDTAAGVSTMLKLTALGSGANGDGGSILLNGKTSTTAAQAMGLDQWLWVDATHASRKARRVFNVYDTAVREAIRIEASGTAPMIGFYGGAAVARGAALTVQLTTLTHTAPGTPDYAIQDFVDVALGAGWAFANHDEANTVLSTIANLQARVAELEARLGSATGVNLFA